MTYISHLRPEETYIHSPSLVDVCELMRNTWDRPCVEFTPDALGAIIHKPNGDPSLSLGLQHRNSLVGFLSYIPLRVLYGNSIYPVVLSRWWTANHNSNSRAIGLKLQKELLKQAREKGYHGVFSITNANSRADKATTKTFQRLNENAFRVNTFTEMMTTPKIAIRRFSRKNILNIRVFDPSMKNDCHFLIEKVTQKVNLSQVLSVEDILYALYKRILTRTWVFQKEHRVRALIHISTNRLLGEYDTSNAYIEHMIFGDLTREECHRFWNGVIHDPFWGQVDAVFIPNTGYVDSNLLSELGFCRTLKKFNLYFVPLDDSLNIEEVSSFYLPVF